MLSGTFVALLPFLGLPSSWDTVFYFLLGVFVITLGIIVRRKSSAPVTNNAIFSKHEAPPLSPLLDAPAHTHASEQQWHMTINPQENTSASVIPQQSTHPPKSPVRVTPPPQKEESKPFPHHPYKKRKRHRGITHVFSRKAREAASREEGY